MKPFFWALLTMITWGIVPIFEKLGLIKVPIWAGLFYRSMGVVIGVLILTFFKLDEIKQALISPPSGWYFLLIGGLMASIVGQIFFYHALKLGEVSRMTVIAGAYPLISFMLGILILKEKVTLAKISGLIFILLGLILLR